MVLELSSGLRRRNFTNELQSELALKSKLLSSRKRQILWATEIDNLSKGLKNIAQLDPHLKNHDNGYRVIVLAFPKRQLIITKGLFMKNNLGRDYFLLAHVDHDRVLFNKPADLGIEFKNEIDAWSMMTFKFSGSRWNDSRYARNDLSSLFYSVRSRVD